MVGFTYISYFAARTSNLVDDIITLDISGFLSLLEIRKETFRVINNDQFNGLTEMTPNFRNA